MHIIASFSTLLSIVAYLGFYSRLNYVPSRSEDLSDSKANVLIILLALKEQLGLIRRFFRTFRFLDAFNSAYTLASSRSMGSMPLVMALDIMARTFNGMYLLLETATLLDAMKIEGLRLLTPELEGLLKTESQRSWFLALVSGGTSCAVVLYKDQLQRASLKHLFKKEQPEKSGHVGEDDSTGNHNGSVSPSQKAQIDRRMKDLDRRRIALARKLTANCFDLALPGSVIGWIPASSGTVGVCMFVTSILTGWDVWERCGREVPSVP